MDVFEAIFTRRSIRKYQPVPIEFEKVGRCIQAMFEAPTAGNIQDVRVIIIQNDATRQKMAEAALQQYWMEQAPVHLVICTDIKRGKQFYGTRGERLYAVQHTGAAAMAILLAAQAQGLGACWVGAFDEEMVKAACGIPDYARPQAIITLGFSDEVVPKPPRFVIESFTYIERYNNKIRNFPIAITEWSPVVMETVKGAVSDINKAGTNVVDWIRDTVKGMGKKKKKK